METRDTFDVIIVGAGASGLAAASVLEQHHKSVLLLEALDRPGTQKKSVIN